MKKAVKLIAFIFVLFAGVFTLTGCNNKEQSNTGKNINDGKGKIYLLLETEGLGQVAYYIDDERYTEFDDEFPKQQAYIRLDGETKVTVSAKADTGSKFVKWVKGKKDYSTEAKLEITVTGATELTAVFTNDYES